MSKVDFKELLDAGVHFGHLKRKWNPKMAPYIFMEQNGIHIIDLHKTAAKLEEASAALSQIAKSGKKIMFVATKNQAKDVVAERSKAINMPFVTERWPGGMLTNFVTIRKAVRKMSEIDKMNEDGRMAALSKRERLQIARQRAKLEKNLGSIADLTRLPAAIFVVDIMKEHIAIAEAKKLGIPTFAIVDTNSNPNLVDFAIPANDDATKSIDKIMELVTAEIAVGLAERKAGKDKAKAEAATKEAAAKATKEAAAKVAATKKAEKPVEKVEATTEEATKEDAKPESK
ncbi:MAG: 30S ribosomal protein S2 [Flavobacteriales bacterium]|tara:strand:+ start:1070 stop:1930 length:861 start_codon:yes stop_codon:yes gene_type:complete